MSTDLKTNGKHQFALTRYWGGKNGGHVQVTGPNCDREIGCIGVSRDEALYLAADLIIFANGLEQEEA